MRLPKFALTAASAVAILLGSVGFTLSTSTAAVAGDVDEGKKIAFHRKKGNCLACHAIEGGNLPGNIGPPLVNMKDRFPDKAKLKSQIYDATSNNPNSIMPPFGKHGILSKQELDKVVEFIYSL
ncbi:MAG: sulfur oxidation c-type cytochrome SoxX [Nitrosomonas sp.]|nr:sulfur oxidation c-type cytochrome SoxX [Nitrosomonas sp.]MDH5727714.1 sulfur oxidation c-type cytochrome SoxX [Gammaproteobacteria bacterium]